MGTGPMHLNPDSPLYATTPSISHILSRTLSLTPPLTRPLPHPPSLTFNQALWEQGQCISTLVWAPTGGVNSIWGGQGASRRIGVEVGQWAGLWEGRWEVGVGQWVGMREVVTITIIITTIHLPRY